MAASYSKAVSIVGVGFERARPKGVPMRPLTWVSNQLRQRSCSRWTAVVTGASHPPKRDPARRIDRGNGIGACDAIHRRFRASRFLRGLDLCNCVAVGRGGLEARLVGGFLCGAGVVLFSASRFTPRFSAPGRPKGRSTTLRVVVEVGNATRVVSSASKLVMRFTRASSSRAAKC